MFEETDITQILTAINFSASKHMKQRRKDGETPYINHPIAVAKVLWCEGGVREPEIIVAAILHDTLEDTETTPEEVQTLFGRNVLALVKEVSDDKSLPKQERKRLQILRAASSSKNAKQIKIADKICNIRDLVRSPPPGWPLERIQQYLEWSDRVMAGLQGVNIRLEAVYKEVVQTAWEQYQS